MFLFLFLRLCCQVSYFLCGPFNQLIVANRYSILRYVSHGRRRRGGSQSQRLGNFQKEANVQARFRDLINLQKLIKKAAQIKGAWKRRRKVERAEFVEHVQQCKKYD